MDYFDGMARNKSRSSHASVQLVLLLGAVTLLAGCMGGAALHNDTIDYSDAYAANTNEQLLNNLARLSHSDPPYFVQLGQITAQHTFNGTAGFANDNSSHNHYGASLSVGAQEQPSFQFVPITGTNFMNAISVPIPTKLFLTFFDQGKPPADMLARVMLDSVVLADREPDENGEKKLVFHLLRNDPLDPSYPDFLLFCIQLRDKQLHDSDFVETPSGKRAFYLTGVKPSDIATNLPAGMDVEPAKTRTEAPGSTNKVAYMPDYNSTNTIISPPNELLIIKNRDLGLLEQYDTQYGTHYASDNFRYSFERELAGKNPGKRHSITMTFALDQVAQGPADDGDYSDVKWWAALKLRTFMSVLSATAKEKERFDEARTRKIFDATNTVFRIDDQGFGHYRDDSANPGQDYLVQPILRITQDSKQKLMKEFISSDVADGTYFSELTSLDYGGMHYVLGDIMDSDGLPLVSNLRDAYTEKNGRQLTNLFSSNKEVFGLISDLFSDINIDAKSLPVQQLIQVQ